MRMALEVEQLALSEKGKESLAIESFARALKQLPTIIADNAGLDSAEVVSNLRNSIYNGSITAGIDVNDGSVGDMKEMGIYECLKVKEQALISACEACEMILRVDMTVTSAPRQRDRE
jgi:T-complex protein 1 subunit beta